MKTKTIAAQAEEIKSSLAQAQKNLAETRVLAPYDGVVTKKEVSAGQTVNMGTVLLSLYAPESIELEALLPSDAYQKVKNTQAKLHACEQSSKAQHCFLLARVGENVAAVGVGHIGYFKAGNHELIQQGDTYRLLLQLPAVRSFLIPAAALYENKSVYLVDANRRLQSVAVQRLGFDVAGDQQQFVIEYQPQLNHQRLLSSYLPDARSGLLVRFKELPADAKK